MALRYPNRTGEVGTYNSGDTITLPGTALPGMRTFAAAATAGKLAANDYLGIVVKRSGNDAIWSVWIAAYTSGTLTLAEEEDSAGTLTDGDQVEVFAALTEAMLSSVSPTWSPDYQMGADYWGNTTAYDDLVWDGTEQSYGIGEWLSNGALTPVNTWATGFVPSAFSAEVFVPIGAGSDAENVYANIVDESSNSTTITVGSGYTEGEWNPISGAVTATDDISYLLFSQSGMPVNGYKIRNILFT